jgi:protein-S-isoprenylcysteine O-methyltransferase Ste14
MDPAARRAGLYCLHIMTALKHLRAIALLPFMVLIIIPAIITYFNPTTNSGWSLPVPLNFIPVMIGLVFIGSGLVLLYKTISLFMRFGKGTLAPWNPTQRLVIRGIYRYVRNPMITGVISVLLGESILLGSISLAGWLAVFTILNLIYIPLLEEPGLEQRFGEDYRRYKQNVPRWIPRLKPWEGKNYS